MRATTGMCYLQISVKTWCVIKGLHCSNLLFITVDDGAVLDVQFTNFYHHPPDGFDSILIEQSLL